MLTRYYKVYYRIYHVDRMSLAQRETAASEYISSNVYYVHILVHPSLNLWKYSTLS